MGQIKNILARLSPKQRIVILATALFFGAGLYGFVHWRKEAGFKPLYTGLAAEDSAAVVQKLKESGAEYRLSDSGDSISVPADRLAELRLEMAGAGLPKTGRMGFEIFDKNNLGATEFVEHINYRRALEGELERSLGTIAAVETARIHITFPKESVFLESREPAKASVLVKLKTGAKLLPRNVTAITRLVASAVEGLSPDAVSVLDMQGNLLSRPTPSTPGEAESEAALDYRQKLERDLLQKISSTLDPLLGRERYRAGVTVECDVTSGEQTEEILDPTRSVMVQSQKTEDVTAPGAQSGGVPGTASNLPRPPARASSTPSSTSRRTENVTYASTRTTRTTKIPQGAVKRISIALLLDQSVRWEGAGPSARRVLSPPSPETIKSVRDIVAAVAGTIETRGDQVTVETLPFETTLNVPAPEAPAPPSAATPSTQFKWTDLRQKPMLIGIGVGAALVLLGMIAMVVLRSRKKKAAKGAPESPKELAAAGAPGASAIESANLAEELQAKLAERDAEQEKADLLALASIKVPPVRTKKTEVLAKQLRQSTKKDPSSAAHVLQEWIHDRN
jgi:flagellar M-ring protein FliF